MAEVYSVLKGKVKRSKAEMLKIAKHMTTISERFLEALSDSGMKAAELARSAYLTQGAISQWSTGSVAEKHAKASTAIKIAKALNVNVEWLISGEGPKRPGEAAKPANLVYVRFPGAARASAGHGAVNPDYEEVEGLSFLPESLRRKGLFAANCGAVKVMGDSMYPRIKDGDVVLYDESDRAIKDGRVYVIRWGDEDSVKRLFRELDGKVRVVSDNSAAGFVDRVINPEDDGFDIKGRVRWIGSWED